MSDTTTTTGHLDLDRFDAIRAPVLAAVEHITRRDGFTTVPRPSSATSTPSTPATTSPTPSGCSTGSAASPGPSSTVTSRTGTGPAAGRPRGGVDLPVCLTAANAATITDHPIATIAGRGYTRTSHHAGHPTPATWRPEPDQPTRTVTEIHRHGHLVLTDQYGTTWTYPARDVIQTALPEPLPIGTPTQGTDDHRHHHPHPRRRHFCRGPRSVARWRITAQPIWRTEIPSGTSASS